ncbi:MAG: NHLP-related RiPP peptide [Pseudomonadota bacterium]|nr:NHLP-related RiPP peptide [Pseudomonadota bacterium]
MNNADKMSDAQVSELLSRLGQDDDYRQLFRDDPQQALAEIGFAGGVPICLQVDQLASKEAINASRDILQSELTGTGAHRVLFRIDAGKLA